ncbi:MAG: hypothetical protein ACK559_41395, partial [bacterium]
AWGNGLLLNLEDGRLVPGCLVVHVALEHASVDNIVVAPLIVCLGSALELDEVSRPAINRPIIDI